LRASGYLQLRYTALEGAEDLWALRRFKMMLGGDINRDWQWFAQALFKDGNKAPNDGRVYFQEGWLRFQRSRKVQFVFGRMKPSFGRERFTPDFELYTINRSAVVRTLIPNGEFTDSSARDIGVQVDGTLPCNFRYAVGVFDGSGANRPVHGIGPMVASRVTIDAIPKRRVLGRDLHLNVGAAISVRNAKDLPFGTMGGPDTRRRLEHFRGLERRGGLETGADWGDVSFRGEYIRASFDFADGSTPISADGYYIEFGKFFGRRWQAVAKLEEFDPNVRIDNDKDLRWLTLGCNYYVRGDHRLKLMANYVFRWERVGAYSNDMLMIQFQWFFL
jgi:phosphate-selective porin